MRMLEVRDAVSSRRSEWKREVMAASEADESDRKGRATLEVVEGTATRSYQEPKRDGDRRAYGGKGRRFPGRWVWLPSSAESA